MSTARLKMSARSPVICIGELLWDIFPNGKRLLGGAPANVAYHLRQLGVEARLVTRIGADELGRATAAELARCNIPLTDLQIDPVLPTGFASVDIGTHGQVGYEFATPAAWDAIEVHSGAPRSIVVFGTLAQRDPRSRAAVQALARSASLKIYDVNMRPPYTTMDTVFESLKMATIVKMNEAEAALIAKHVGLDQTPAMVASHIMKQYGPAALCVTRAERGAWLATADGVWTEVEGISVPAADPVGAGDAFLAAIVAGHIQGIPWHKMLNNANRLGAWVASQLGAMPSYGDSQCPRL